MRLLQALLVGLVLAACGLLVWQGVRRLGGPASSPQRVEPRDPKPPQPEVVEQPPVPPEPVATVREADPASDLRREISAKNSRAIQLLKAGDFDGAVTLFEECLEAEPGEPVFLENLAAALARQAMALHESELEAERVRALELLQRSLELDDSRAGLARLLERWRRTAAAEEGFDSYGSERFQLVFDGFRPDLADGIPDVLERLELVYLEYGELFGFFPVEAGRPRIRVVFYRAEQFDNVTGLGHWAGGVFDGNVRLPVEDLGRERRRVDTVLRHELAHAFVLESGGTKVPGWLNEGLAQWLEESSPGRRVDRVAAARTKLRAVDLFPVDRLQGSLAAWKDEAQIKLAYAQSLTMVEHVARQYGERRLFEMVAGCKQGTPAEETFRREMGLTMSVLLEDLTRELH